jgi:hypothetical protein
MGDVADYHKDPGTLPSPPPERRFFLALAKGEEDPDAKLKSAHEAVKRFAQGKPYAITLARTFWEAEFKRCGSWEAYAREVACGVDYMTREALFHAILVPAGRIGAATRRIVEHAIEIGKPVFAFHADGKVARVVRVTCEDPKDWQTGYKMTVAAHFA